MIQYYNRVLKYKRIFMNHLKKIEIKKFKMIYYRKIMILKYNSKIMIWKLVNNYNKKFKNNKINKMVTTTIL